MFGLEDFLHLLNAARDFLHVGARGVEDGAAFQLDAVNGFKRERDEVVFEHTAPAVEEADEFVAVVV